MSETLFGFQRLAQMHSLSLAQPLFSFSRLGAVRQRAVTPQGEALTWPPQYQPEDTFRGHFEFGLKYELSTAENRVMRAISRWGRVALQQRDDGGALVGFQDIHSLAFLRVRPEHASCPQVPTVSALRPCPRSIQVGEFDVAISGGIWVAIRV